MIRTARMGLMRRIVRRTSCEDVLRMRKLVTTGNVSMRTTGVMTKWTVRTNLMRCSAMWNAPVTCSDASFLHIAFTRSGVVMGSETAVMEVMRLTVQ